MPDFGPVRTVCHKWIAFATAPQIQSRGKASPDRTDQRMTHRVGTSVRTHWRDSILNENREEFDTALNNMRQHLAELEAWISF
jgi:hypothetical protein